MNGGGGQIAAKHRAAGAVRARKPTSSAERSFCRAARVSFHAVRPRAMKPLSCACAREQGKGGGGTGGGGRQRETGRSEEEARPALVAPIGAAARACVGHSQGTGGWVGQLSPRQTHRRGSRWCRKSAPSADRGRRQSRRCATHIARPGGHDCVCGAVSRQTNNALCSAPDPPRPRGAAAAAAAANATQKRARSIWQLEREGTPTQHARGRGGGNAACESEGTPQNARVSTTTPRSKPDLVGGGEHSEGEVVDGKVRLGGVLNKRHGWVLDVWVAVGEEVGGWR